MAITLALLAAFALPLAFDDPYEENDTCADAAPLVVPDDGVLHSFPFVSSGAASSGGADDDWFQVDVPGFRRLQVLTHASAPGGPGVEVHLHRGAGCGTTIGSSAISGPALEAFNASASTESYFVEIRPVDPSFVSEALTLQLRIDDAPCTGLAPDAFEPNDSIADATPLAPGILRDLTIDDHGDVDVFEVQVAPGDALRVGYGAHADFANPATCQVKALWPDGSANTIFTVASHSGLQRVLNSSSTDRMWIEVAHFATHPTAPCDRYDLVVATETTACSGGPDPFEGSNGNHDFADATLLVPGSYSGAWTGRLDLDTYAVDVAPGAGLRWKATAALPGRPLTARLHIQAGPTFVATAVSGGAPAELVHANVGSVTQRIWIRVHDDAAAGAFDCTPYSFTVEAVPALVTAVHCDGTDLATGLIEPRFFGSADPFGGGLHFVPEGIAATGHWHQALLFVGLPVQPPPALSGSFCLGHPVERWLRFDSSNDRAWALDPLTLIGFSGTTVAAQQFSFAAGTRVLSSAVTFVIP